MIHVLLYGGLGNQMFQYAVARGLAARHGTSVVVDVSAFPFDIYNRRFELQNFRISARVSGDPRKPRALTQWPAVRKAVWRAHTRVLPWMRYRVVTERGFAFDAQVANAPDGVCLRGYFQSERYFRDIAPLIRAEFEVANVPSGANQRMLDKIRSCDAVCVHFRVGHHDGNKAQSNDKMGMTPREYYDRAVSSIVEGLPNPKVFVFADKPDWVRENVRFPVHTEIVDINDGDSGHEDLRLMTACKHFIIPNSTLSWWGAWLSPFSEKRVIAPKAWFQGMSHDTSDLIPSAWTRL